MYSLHFHLALLEGPKGGCFHHVEGCVSPVWSVRRSWVISVTMIVSIAVATTITTAGIMTASSLASEMVEVPDGSMPYELDTLVLDARLA